jgi:DNA-directed RNA polymerase subunit E'/Rpb7
LARKIFPEFDKEVEKSVTEALSLSILVCDRVSVRYVKICDGFSYFRVRDGECVSEFDR